MALQDIINAIVQAADREIEQARAAHQKEMSALKAANEEALLEKKAEIEHSRNQKMSQLQAKTENHAAMQKRNRTLGKKRELLDTLYADVVKALENVSDSDCEKILKSAIASLKTKGTIHPAARHEKLISKVADSNMFTIGDTIDASGGFRFVSEKYDADFTFEHLVQEVLRPQTELDISNKLFS